MKNFYLMYRPYLENAPKIGEQKEDFPITQQVVEQIAHDIFSIPWGHHVVLMDKFKENPQKALFFARQTVENGWSRSSLLFYPEKVEGTMPSIEEIEKRLCEVPL